MNAPTVFASVLLATGAAFGVTLLATPAEPAVLDTTAADAEIAELRDRLAALQQKLDKLAMTPAHAAPASQRTEVPTLSNEQVASAVEAYLTRRRADGAVPADLAGGNAAPADIKSVFEGVVGTRFWDNAEAWRKAHAEGRMDELIGMFETDAEAFPNDIGKQMDLANAYMAYMQMDQTKWEMSMKADGAFDRVLAIDDHHWEARFTKAVSYTFWPEFLGKKNAAISHFQTLVEQQESLPVEQHHAETYLYLGNLLESKDPEQARAMWRRGSTRHPTNEELRKKLGQ